MTVYTLYNRRLKKQLAHPQVGTWYTTDPEEARDMLEAARAYVRGLGVSGYDADIVVMDSTTGGEAAWSTPLATA